MFLSADGRTPEKCDRHRSTPKPNLRRKYCGFPEPALSIPEGCPCAGDDCQGAAAGCRYAAGVPKQNQPHEYRRCVQTCPPSAKCHSQVQVQAHPPRNVNKDWRSKVYVKPDI